MSNHALSELIDRIASEKRTWVRAAAVSTDAGWSIVLLEVTLGAPSPGWRRIHWSYPRAEFASWAPAGATVARWFSSGRLNLLRTPASFSPDQGVSRDWRESGWSGIYEPLMWPSTDWTVRTDQIGAIALHGELVAADAPAFLSFDEAARALLCVPRMPNRHFNGIEIVVREQATAARISSVMIRPSEVEVGVEGDGLRGTYLTLGSSTGSSKRLTSKSRTIRLTMMESPGPGTWLALHRGDELLDRRVLDPAWRQRDVEVEIDLATEVQLTISRGEGPGVEFKRQLPGRDPHGPMKTISAFANGGGGVLLFGVEDDGQIVGLSDDDLPDLRGAVDRVANLINDYTRPPVPCELHVVEIGDVSVLAVFVPPGVEPPYAVGTTDRKLTYYVRRGATSAPARPSDVRAAVRSRIASSATERLP